MIIKTVVFAQMLTGIMITGYDVNNDYEDGSVCSNADRNYDNSDISAVDNLIRQCRLDVFRSVTALITCR